MKNLERITYQVWHKELATLEERILKLRAQAVREEGLEDGVKNAITEELETAYWVTWRLTEQLRRICDTLQS